jgi:Skp family chaperone for outer membrane proteins
LTGAILKELQEIIRGLGEREGYTVILESTSSAILYGSPSADLTETVMREYNRRRH